MDPDPDRYGRAASWSVSQCAREGFQIAITCKCGHRRIIDPVPLWRTVKVKRWPDDLIPLTKHLRCARCNKRWPEAKPTSEPVDSEPAVGLKSDAEAQQMVKRFRS